MYQLFHKIFIKNKSTYPNSGMILSREPIKHIIGLDIKPEYPKNPHIILRNNFKKNINAYSEELMIKIKKHLN